jgi:hypothetical protein
MKPKSVDELVASATDAKNQINLLKVTAPFVLLILGFVFAGIGLFLFLGAGRRRSLGIGRRRAETA